MGTMDINSCAEVTTPPIVLMAISCTKPSIARKRVKMFSQFFDNQDISELQFLRAQKELLQSKKELLSKQSKLKLLAIFVTILVCKQHTLFQTDFARAQFIIQRQSYLDHYP
jgi:hypothetical protein